MPFVALHNFLIINNNSATKNFDEADNCASDINADNELNRPVSDGADNFEMLRQLTNYMIENFMV